MQKSWLFVHQLANHKCWILAALERRPNSKHWRTKLTTNWRRGAETWQAGQKKCANLWNYSKFQWLINFRVRNNFLTLPIFRCVRYTSTAASVTRRKQCPPSGEGSTSSFWARCPTPAWTCSTTRPTPRIPSPWSWGQGPGRSTPCRSSPPSGLWQCSKFVPPCSASPLSRWTGKCLIRGSLIPRGRWNWQSTSNATRSWAPSGHFAMGWEMAARSRSRGSIQLDI